MALNSSVDGCLGGSRASQRALEGARQTYSQEVALRVRAVLDDMASHGVVPSFYAVAERACVARSTLYRRPELKHLVAEAREAALRPALRAGDAEGLQQGAAALRREVAALRSENALLGSENVALRRENEDLRRECSSLRSTLTSTMAECEHLKARLAAVDDRPAEAQMRYDVCPWDAAA